MALFVAVSVQLCFHFISGCCVILSNNSLRPPINEYIRTHKQTLFAPSSAGKKMQFSALSALSAFSAIRPPINEYIRTHKQTLFAPSSAGKKMQFSALSALSAFSAISLSLSRR